MQNVARSSLTASTPFFSQRHHNVSAMDVALAILLALLLQYPLYVPLTLPAINYGISSAENSNRIGATLAMVILRVESEDGQYLT